jgi:osmotically-inducible protein OsmY
MKSDVQLQQDVAEAILWEPSISSKSIVVTARNGIVTLGGTVPYYSEKSAVERTTQHVYGVKAIANELEIIVLGAHKRNDEDIAQAVVDTLSWHVWIPDTILASIENGWITLSGSVTWGYQRSAAAESLKYLRGVKGITNNITLYVSVKPTAIKDAIEKILKRHSEIDEKNVTITTEGGKVNISGTIRTWSERDDVSTAAWSTPGVTAVENNLAVTF